MDSAEWAALRAKAKTMADSQFATKASDIASLTKKEVLEILTETSVNKDVLASLMAMVSDATKTNKEKAQAIKNINGFAELAVSLIGKLA